MRAAASARIAHCTRQPRRTFTSPSFPAVSHSDARPAAPQYGAGDDIRAQAQSFLLKQISDRAHRGEVESAHRIQTMMARLMIPTTKQIDVAFMSVLKPTEGRDLFAKFKSDDALYPEAVISMIQGFAAGGEFQDALNLLKEHDPILTRNEPNGRQILYFWLSFNRVPEAIAELRRQEATGRKDAAISHSYVLVAAANNNLVAETKALLKEAHEQEIVVPPWAYDRVMALFWRLNQVQDAIELAKDIKTRSPHHWQRHNGSLKHVIDLLLRTNNWTKENRELLLQGCTVAQAEVAYGVIQRFDYPSAKLQALQTQVRELMSDPSAAPTRGNQHASGKKTTSWDDLELM